MMGTQNLPQDLFLLNLNNEDFVRGKSRKFGGWSIVRRSLLSFIAFTGFISLPVAVVFGIIMSFTGKITFLSGTLLGMGVMTLFGGYIVYIGVNYRRRLEHEGQVLIGQVIKYDTRLAYTFRGYKTACRLNYSFSSPQGKEVAGSVLIPHSFSHLPDGRELPTLGAHLAIVYVNDLHHMPL